MTARTTCSQVVDYSQVTGERILPFRFTLNEEKSILTPEPGQFQRFCYDIEGVGRDTSLFADLSHFVLGICETITEEDIREITVVKNGVPQNVVLGQNVEIRTEEHPDPPTGCVGLKFDFSLDKEDGRMEVCITMQHPFMVGPVNVCVFGGNTTATGMSICGPACGEEESCESVFFQTETVCVPVKVTPFAEPGEAKATCCGEPIIKNEEHCPNGRKSCTFTITQKLCIEIPISFGAVIETGEATVQCGEVSKEPCDCDDDDDSTVLLDDRNGMRERAFFNTKRVR